MLEIREFEELLNGSRNFDEASDNRTMLWAYENTRAEDNARLDFNDVICEEDINQIAEVVRRVGIKEFTISCATFGLIRILAAFEELGIRFAGIVKVNSRFHVWNSTEHEVIPAFLMKVE